MDWYCNCYYLVYCLSQRCVGVCRRCSAWSVTWATCLGAGAAAGTAWPHPCATPPPCPPTPPSPCSWRALTAAQSTSAPPWRSWSRARCWGRPHAASPSRTGSSRPPTPPLSTVTSAESCSGGWSNQARLLSSACCLHLL